MSESAIRSFYLGSHLAEHRSSSLFYRYMLQLGISPMGWGRGVPPHSQSPLPQILPVPVPNPRRGGFFSPIPIPISLSIPMGSPSLLNFFSLGLLTQQQQINTNR